MITHQKTAWLGISQRCKCSTVESMAFAASISRGYLHPHPHPALLLYGVYKRLIFRVPTPVDALCGEYRLLSTHKSSPCAASPTSVLFETSTAPRRKPRVVGFILDPLLTPAANLLGLPREINRWLHRSAIRLVFVLWRLAGRKRHQIGVS